MKRRAFTLVELLVVIAVIALLMAILMPSLRISKHYARAVLCSSNIKQLLFCLTVYESENGVFPHSSSGSVSLSELPGDPSYDKLGQWWFDYIIGYRKKEAYEDSVLWCPSRNINYIRFKFNVLIGNYGVNQSICKSTLGKTSHSEFLGTPLSGMEIQYPSQTLLLVDSGYGMINWWHVTDIPPVSLGNSIEDNTYVPGLSINKDKILKPGREEDGNYGRHPNKTVNVGFADGHINRVKAEDLLVEKTDGGYKNSRPLWLPN